MSDPEKIKEWLEKMQFPNEIPTNEKLQDFCRGPLGPIFQQIIDKVKPKNEIEGIRMNLIINRLKKRDKKINKEQDEKLGLYNKKQQLEKQLKETKERIKNKEDSLEMLKSKQKKKNVKIEVLKQKIKQNQKEETVFRAKSTELTKQLQNAIKVKSEGSVATSNGNHKELNQLIENILEKITYQIDNCDISCAVSKKHSIPKKSSSALLYSCKKPLSIRKNKQSASKRNVFESVNNLCAISGIRKSNVMFSSTTSLCSNVTSKSTMSVASGMIVLSGKSMGSLDRPMESNSIFDFISSCCPELRKNVETLWMDTNRRVLWEMLNEMKKNDKEKFIGLIGEPKMKVLNSNTDHMEILYHCHIQNALINNQNKLKHKHLLEILEKEFENIDEYTALSAMENGIQAAMKVLKSAIEQIRTSTVEDPKLDESLKKIDEIQTEMSKLKLKIENGLCLLHDSSIWMEKSYRNVREIALGPIPTLEEEINYMSNTMIEQFCNLPFNYMYMDEMQSWSEACLHPELLEIIDSPRCSVDKFVSNVLATQSTIQKLQQYKIQNVLLSIPDCSTVLEANCDVQNESETKNVFLQSLDMCDVTSSLIDRLEEVFKIKMNHPFEEFVSEERLFNGKNLQYYIKTYEDLVKKLPKDS